MLNHGDEPSLSIISANLVKILKVLNRIVYFDQILNTYTFYHCLDTSMQIDDKAPPIISPASLCQLLKMLMTRTHYGRLKAILKIS